MCTGVFRRSQDPSGRRGIPYSKSLTGAQGLQWLDHLRVDIAFIGASGLHEKEGASTTSLEEAAIKQTAMARAQRSVLLCDLRKLEKPSTICFAPWSGFDQWIVDKKPCGSNPPVKITTAGYNEVRTRKESTCP